MAALSITYADYGTTDWDGNPVTTRTYVATIDGAKTGLSASCPTTADDATVRQALRDLLADKGFAWDTEI